VLAKPAGAGGGSKGGWSSPLAARTPSRLDSSRGDGVRSGAPRTRSSNECPSARCVHSLKGRLPPEVRFLDASSPFPAPQCARRVGLRVHGDDRRPAAGGLSAGSAASSCRTASASGLSRACASAPGGLREPRSVPVLWAAPRPRQHRRRLVHHRRRARARLRAREPRLVSIRARHLSLQRAHRHHLLRRSPRQPRRMVLAPRSPPPRLLSAEEHPRVLHLRPRPPSLLLPRPLGRAGAGRGGTSARRAGTTSRGAGPSPGRAELAPGRSTSERAGAERGRLTSTPHSGQRFPRPAAWAQSAPHRHSRHLLPATPPHRPAAAPIDSGAGRPERARARLGPRRPGRQRRRRSSARPPLDSPGGSRAASVLQARRLEEASLGQPALDQCRSLWCATLGQALPVRSPTVEMGWARPSARPGGGPEGGIRSCALLPRGRGVPPGPSRICPCFPCPSQHPR
jgi:hypothetical protein